MRAARANLYPTLSAGPSISRRSRLANRPLATPGGTTTYGDFVIAGQASWEPDFWGRIRRTVEQARANAQASAADAANVALTLHAEMATDYFALRGLDSQIKLLDRHGRRPRAPARPDAAALCRRRGHRGGRGAGADAA